jgi:hypothetical protein
MTQVLHKASQQLSYDTIPDKAHEKSYDTSSPPFPNPTNREPKHQKPPKTPIPQCTGSQQPQNKMTKTST